MLLSLRHYNAVELKFSWGWVECLVHVRMDGYSATLHNAMEGMSGIDEGDEDMEEG